MQSHTSRTRRWMALGCMLALSACGGESSPNAVSLECGARGQPCCMGGACNAGLACLAGATQFECGGPSACGAASQPCCQGASCASGLVCAVMGTGLLCVAAPSCT